VAADGTVLFDNWEDASKMSNHGNRREIQDALESGTGAVIRRSDTMAKRTVYYAVRLENGTVLRMASAYDSLWSLMLRSLWQP
jgi:two-component system phosphate regulon sensor histidine kinase PhoR